MKRKNKTRVETQTHALDREHAEVKKRLQKINRELNTEKNNIAIWIITILLIMTMIITSVEILRILNPTVVEDYKIKTHEQKFILLDDENWMYVLKNITLAKDTYQAGENLTILIQTESQKRSPAEII